LLTEVLTDPPLNLALIQWYDFKSKRNPYLYGCPHLKLIELYNFVAIESIHGVVHIHWSKSRLSGTYRVPDMCAIYVIYVYDI
jgi:hypothetical protein